MTTHRHARSTSPLATLLAAGLLALGLQSAARPAAPPTTSADKTVVKLATLIPEGSVWDKSLRRMAEETQTATDGRVTLRLYPGGVAGDEPDIVRKLRVGQLHAASMTSTGLGIIDESFKLFEVPLFFQSDEEVYHVIEAITPMIRARLEAKGYILLGWAHTGWVRFFTTRSVDTVDGLRGLKMFVWAGDNTTLDWWRKQRFTAVPLALHDILTGLQTGMIEALPSTPIASLSLQWFRHAPYMIDERILPFMAGTIISKKTWEELSEADRSALMESAGRTQQELFEAIPEQDSKAVAEMRKRGLTVVPPRSEAGDNPWHDLANSFADEMRDTLVPADVWNAAIAAREEFRSGAAGAAD